MPTDTTCGACGVEQPTLGDVYSHACAASERMKREKAARAFIPLEVPAAPAAPVPMASVRVLLTRHRGHPTAERVRVLLNEARESGPIPDNVVGMALDALQSITTPTPDEGNTDAAHHGGRASR